MPSIRSILTIVTVTFLSHVVSGFTTGTGSCAAGVESIENTAPGNSHILYDGYPGDTTSTRPGVRGTLTDALTSLSINGVTVTDFAATVSVPVGTDVTWEVVAEQMDFKGIFVRVEKSSADFTLVAADTTTLQPVALCDALTGVEGLTHLNSAVKTSSSGTFNFASAGAATLDITLVFNNVESSVYAWSSIALNAEDAGAPVAPTPVAAPVDAPLAVPVATPAPVADVPTDATPAPVDVPTETPPPAVPTVPTVEPPTAEPPTDECPEGKGKGKGKGKGEEDDEEGKGKGMGMMGKKGKKCKKAPKEPKTPKAGKGGKGKGSDDDSA